MSKINVVQNSPKKTINSPIKIVENSKSAKYKNKYLNQVVNGKGISAAIGAVPISYKDNKEGLPTEVWWQTLLDSGSDGDLLFITKKQLKNIPYEKRYAAKKWQTSTGTFKTTHVGNLDIMFPAFSRSKIFSIQADIVIVPENVDPLFNLILDIDTLAKFGTVLDFKNETVEIDSAVNSMRPLIEIRSKINLSQFVAAGTEPISTKSATKRTVEILDASYEKANLPKVIKNTCGHLSKIEQAKLLTLLLKYEELFDGTLGNFETDPVHFNLKPDVEPYYGRPYPVPKSQLEVFKKR